MPIVASPRPTLSTRPLRSWLLRLSLVRNGAELTRFPLPASPQLPLCYISHLVYFKVLSTHFDHGKHVLHTSPQYALFSGASARVGLARSMRRFYEMLVDGRWSMVDCVCVFLWIASSRPRIAPTHLNGRFHFERFSEAMRALPLFAPLQLPSPIDYGAWVASFTVSLHHQLCMTLISNPDRR